MRVGAVLTGARRTSLRISKMMKGKAFERAFVVSCLGADAAGQGNRHEMHPLGFLSKVLPSLSSDVSIGRFGRFGSLGTRKTGAGHFHGAAELKLGPHARASAASLLRLAASALSLEALEQEAVGHGIAIARGAISLDANVACIFSEVFGILSDAQQPGCLAVGVLLPVNQLQYHICRHFGSAGISFQLLASNSRCLAPQNEFYDDSGLLGEDIQQVFTPQVIMQLCNQAWLKEKHLFCIYRASLKKETHVEAQEARV
ncbi:unnamed protein product [Symbiodinium sp. CCMP2592]|nr:unnamed protein product [Symbiodinium sp. CCMP2592]